MICYMILKTVQDTEFKNKHDHQREEVNTSDQNLQIALENVIGSEVGITEIGLTFLKTADQVKFSFLFIVKS